MPISVVEPNRSALAEQLRAAGVDGAEVLAELARPSIRITAKRTSLTEIAPGASRFAGAPDVPKGFEWPTWKDRPLAFLAQVDLSEIAADELPTSGWLLFFYDVAEQPWGFDPQDAGSARVIYFDGRRDDLGRLAHPPIGGDADALKPCSIAFAATVDLPHPWDTRVSAAGIEIDPDQTDAYHEVLDTLSGVDTDPAYHHLMGHPQLIQSDMRDQCQLATNGVYCGNAKAYESAKAKELLRDTSDWRLLLQIDSDEDRPGWMWGDCGRLYFWIRQADLAARDFTKAWLILQCS